jgi:hypothetical protein
MKSSMNKKHINKNILAMVLGLLSLAASAQEKPYREPTGLNNWYIELGGNSLFYSGNYEKVLIKEGRWGWVGRVGVGYNPGDYTLLNEITLDGGTIIAPFHTSVLFGPNKEKLELGFGFTMLGQSISKREIVPTAVLGFRVVETNKICFRINYAPFIRNGEYTGWFGVSIGRNFSTGSGK